MAQPQPSPSLSELRAEIDRIDDSIHDAIMRRAELVTQIRAAKPAGVSTVRPAREAEILRRLMGRHGGQFPRSALVQMWLTMINAFTYMQGSITIGVMPPLQDVARDQYGALAEIDSYDDVTRLISHVEAGSLSLGVLPWPRRGMEWWCDLAELYTGVSVVACVPLAGKQAGASGVAIGKLALQPSGDDLSWIVTDGAELPFPDALTIARSGEKRLVQVTRFVPQDLQLPAGCTLIGSFPKPLTLDEDTP